jgi:hypothetical protein
MSSQKNIVPRIDAHRGRLQLIHDRLDNPKTRKNVSKADRFCIDQRIKEIDYITNMYYYYFNSIIIRTMAKKKNEYDYDYEYDHKDEELMDSLMVKFERQLHRRNETLQQILHRVDKYLNNKKRDILRSHRLGLDAIGYKYSVDARLREIEYFSGTYDGYLHPESCKHYNPDYSTGE